MANEEIIQLDRRFLELRETDSDHLTDHELAVLAGMSGRSWEQILEHRCVVILGEAGTGKTTEFAQRAKLLVASGQAAFSLRVEDLAKDGLEGALPSRVERRRFAAWRASSERAYFFLDAIDEARLNDQGFETALRRLEQALDDELHRAHLLISCRVSDWRARSDRDAIAAILYPEDDENVGADGEGASPTAAGGGKDPARRGEPPVRVFALARLDEAQIERLVASLGVADPRAFTAAARRATAHAYLDRPRDVRWLAGYWRQHGAFGSLTALIEHDVTEKLTERNLSRQTPRGASLSATKARTAAEVLAGMAALQRRSSFLLPDEPLDAERATTSLDPAHVLADLNPPERAQVLTLPLFDVATYGRVRIHHRTVAEYLAARWLHALLRKGLAPSEIEALLFRRGPDGLVVPKELVAVAAWLAASEEMVRERLLEVAPTVLLEGGDPNRFPEDFRRRLLQALAAQYAARGRLFRSFDPAALGRLASGGIADTINDLLRTSMQEELLELLLTIVSEGGLRGCAGEALRLALDAATPVHARLDAVRAVAKVGTPLEIEALLAATVDSAADIEHELGGALVGAMYPASIDVARLLVLLSQVRPPPPQTGTALTLLLRSMVYKRTPAADRVLLLHGILELVRVAGQPKQARRPWLLGPLASMTSQYAAEHSGEGLRPLEPILLFFAHLGARRGLGFEHGGHEIRELVAARPDLRQIMFWAHAAVVREKKPNLSRFFELRGTERPWTLDGGDCEWLERDARTRLEPLDRLLAFDCLVAAPCTESERPARDEFVRRVAETDPAFQKRLDEYQRPRAKDPEETRWQEELRREEERERRAHETRTRRLHEHLRSIEDGTDEPMLRGLAGEVDVDPQEPGAAMTRLAEIYDPTIAAAARAGWCRLWRRLRCPLPHEEAERSVISYSFAGFAGLTLEIEDGLDLAGLTPEEARDAARYAARGMNRFPPWLDRLAQSQPAAVLEIFAECIRADFGLPIEAASAYGVLHLLSNASSCVREPCAPVLTELLAAGEPPRLDTLENVLDALVATPASHAALVGIAPGRCAAASQDRARLVRWWCAWLAVDPPAAITHLEGAIECAPATADELVLGVCERLWRLGRYSGVHFPYSREAAVLTRLVAILFSHVRPEDDVRHIGVYSRGARDHAESLRRYLLDQLAGTPGDDAYRGLRELAERPALASSREYLLALAEQRVSQDAGRRDTEVADLLVSAYRRHGLGAIELLAEAGLRIVPPETRHRKQIILLLAANPSNTDRHALDREARAIQVELERSGHRDRFELVTRWAAEPLDLLDQLRRLRPAVVHVCGRGGREGLSFHGVDGRARLVSIEAIAEAFGAVDAPVLLAVLSACYSEAQADALLAHVPCIAGTPSTFGDDAARSFATGLYGALGDGESIAAAFRQGRAAIQLEGHERPDVGMPLLAVRDGIDAGAIDLAADRSRTT